MRDLPANFAALLENRVVAPVFFLHLDWPQSPVYWVTAYGAISWDGKWWAPTGEFMQIAQISESNDARANGVQLTLSGIPSQTLASIFRNDFQGRKAQIYIGFLNEQGGLITAPLRILRDLHSGGELGEGTHRPARRGAPLHPRRPTTRPPGRPLLRVSNMAFDEPDKVRQVEERPNAPTPERARV